MTATTRTWLVGLLPGQTDPRDGGPIDLPDLPHAWTTPYLWVFDTARVGLVAVSLYLIYLLAFSVFLSHSRAQRAITTSFGLAVMALTWSQIERIGRPVSWRLPVVTLMLGLGVWGVFHYMSGGERYRDLTLRSWFIPPPPSVVPAQPIDMARRLRAARAKARVAEAASDAATTRRADAHDRRDANAGDLRSEARDLEHAADTSERDDAVEQAKMRAKETGARAAAREAEAAVDDAEARGLPRPPP